MTQLEMTTSTASSGRGMASITPFKKRTFSTPASARLRSASSSIASVISSPQAKPVAPTRFAESKTSMPPPLPRSSTRSPAFNSASAVGLPQPSEARAAAIGNVPSSSLLYKSLVIGSPDAAVQQPPLLVSVLQQVGPQQALPSV